MTKADIDRIEQLQHESARNQASRTYHKKKREEAEARLAVLERENERLREALDGVLIGGNHLALLIGADHPPHIAEPALALEHYGAGDVYEIWCCWRSIMNARAALSTAKQGTSDANNSDI